MKTFNTIQKFFSPQIWTEDPNEPDTGCPIHPFPDSQQSLSEQPQAAASSTPMCVGYYIHSSSCDLWILYLPRSQRKRKTKNVRVFSKNIHKHKIGTYKIKKFSMGFKAEFFIL